MWKKIESMHRAARYPLPAVIAPNPLIENYKAGKRAEESTLQAKLSRCSTLAQTVTVAVCHEFGLTKEELLGPARFRQYVVPRQVAMHIMSKHSGRNTRGVARVFNKDHTCVINANVKVPKIAAIDSHLAAKIRGIESYIGTN